MHKKTQYKNNLINKKLHSLYTKLKSSSFVFKCELIVDHLKQFSKIVILVHAIRLLYSLSVIY